MDKAHFGYTTFYKYFITNTISPLHRMEAAPCLFQQWRLGALYPLGNYLLSLFQAHREPGRRPTSEGRQGGVGSIYLLLKSKNLTLQKGVAGHCKGNTEDAALSFWSHFEMTVGHNPSATEDI